MKKTFIKIFALSIIGVLSSCSSGFSKGKTVHTTRECFSAINKSCYNVMTDFSVERNEYAIRSMMNDGEVYILPSHTYGKVTDYESGAYEVDFSDYGKLWVASDFLDD